MFLVVISVSFEKRDDLIYLQIIYIYKYNIRIDKMSAEFSKYDENKITNENENLFTLQN